MGKVAWAAERSKNDDEASTLRRTCILGNTVCKGKGASARMEPVASDRLNGKGLPRERTASELLRMIGSLLDELEMGGITPMEFDRRLSPLAEHQDRLQQVNVIDHGDFVSFTWEAADRVGNRSLTHAELRELSHLGGQERHSSLRDSAGGWHEQMRTLGQLLDAEGVQVAGVFAYEGRIDVAGTLDGESVELSYTADELALVSDLRRLLRSDALAS
jgi:hypothetical protein